MGSGLAWWASGRSGLPIRIQNALAGGWPGFNCDISNILWLLSKPCLYKKAHPRFFKPLSVSVFVPDCNSWHFSKLCLRLIPAEGCRGIPWEARGSIFLLSILPKEKRCSRWGVQTTSAHNTATATTHYLGLRVFRDCLSLSGEGPVPAVRLPSNFLLWHMRTSHQRAQPVCAWWSSPRLQWTPTTMGKNILHLDIHFWVMISYVLFFINVSPEGLQPSSEFPYCGTSCFRAADKECQNGCKATCPFLILLSPIATIFKKPPVNCSWRYCFPL